MNNATSPYLQNTSLFFLRVLYFWLFTCCSTKNGAFQPLATFLKQVGVNMVRVFWDENTCSRRRYLKGGMGVYMKNILTILRRGVNNCYVSCCSQPMRKRFAIKRHFFRVFSCFFQFFRVFPCSKRNVFSLRKLL